MRKILFAFVSMLFLSWSATAFSAEKVYTFGFVPQQSASVLAKLWGPILKAIGDEAGFKVAFRTAPSIPEFEDRVRNGDYDFVYMNPVHYTIFANAPGYRAFAKQKGKLIKGILVTRKDSPLQSIEELAGQTLAFPAPAAFAASVLPRSYLRTQGISIEPQYVGSHDSVYHSVAKKLFPAGGGIQRTLSTVAPEIGEQLRVLWTTKGYTPHAFAAHPRIPSEDVSAVQNALVNLFATPKGKELLLSVGFKEGAEMATDENWDDVRELGITSLPK